MKKVLTIPHYVRQGIKHSKAGLDGRYHIIGGDTETCRGEPFLLQLCSSSGNQLLWGDKTVIFDNFLDHAEDTIGRGETGLYYFHNLEFDLVALLYNYDLTKFKDSEFQIQHRGWDCNIYCGKRYFAKFTKDRHKSLYIIDSAAFLPFSLSKIAKELKLPMKKLDKPEGLGKRVFTESDKDFVEYAKNDSAIEYEVGKWIYSAHEKFNTKLSVSLPQMSGYIFRSHFMKENDHIALPPEAVLRASIHSYHGGKNGLYCKAGLYHNCSEIDLNSAYAYAMKCLPSFFKGKFQAVKEFKPDYEGVYRVSGSVHCPYNIFFTHDFKPIQGKFSNIWVTSHELRAALAYKEVELTDVSGYVWTPESKRNPFGDYVDYFYAKKQSTSKEDSLYTFYKLAMNALYGKTIQAVPIVNDETKNSDFELEFDKKGNPKLKKIQQTYRAGGIFNPFIATLITGKVRAMIHELEHRFKALHTATDSVKTLLPITGCSNELGGYKLEVTGDCYIFRNKLYLHYDKDKKLQKFALHGFAGKASDLIDVYEKRGKEYKINHLFKVKEALIQKQIPLNAVEGISRKLNLDWTQFKERN